MARQLGFSFANTGACAQAQVHHSLLRLPNFLSNGAPLAGFARRLRYQFYKELYTSTGVSPNYQKFNSFFNKPALPKISEVQKQSCEGLLTKEERLLSLKQMAKRKSPGTDGLSAHEFNLTFCRFRARTSRRSKLCFRVW